MLITHITAYRGDSHIRKEFVRNFMILTGSSGLTPLLLLLFKHNMISVPQNILLIPVLFSAQGLSTLRILPSFTSMASVVITLSTSLPVQNTLAICIHNAALIKQKKWQCHTTPKPLFIHTGPIKWRVSCC